MKRYKVGKQSVFDASQSFIKSIPKDVTNTIYFELWKDNISQVHTEYYKNFELNDFDKLMYRSKEFWVMINYREEFEAVPIYKFLNDSLITGYLSKNYWHAQLYFDK